ncbi:MAG: hypothetical protein ACOX60_04805 [Massiliimalia sp.]
MKLSENWVIKPLSVLETLECIRCAEELEREMLVEDSNAELVKAVYEYGALGYFSIYEGNVRKFSSPREVLCQLTLDQLADFYEEYCRLHQGNQKYWEAEQNESFERQVKQGENI